MQGCHHTDGTMSANAWYDCPSCTTRIELYGAEVIRGQRHTLREDSEVFLFEGTCYVIVNFHCTECHNEIREKHELPWPAAPGSTMKDDKVWKT